MEFVAGIKVSNRDELAACGFDCRLIACRGADQFLEMVLDHGFFMGTFIPEMSS